MGEIKENPEKDYKSYPQWLKNVQQFQKSGRILYGPTKNMYEFITNYCIDFTRNHPQYPDFIWKPKVADVGCGGGYGSNILSQEADFVWGVDASEQNIAFAREMFTRKKNGVYYSPQVSFDVINVTDEPREIMAFDIVVCIEIIEHVAEYEKMLAFIKRLAKRNKDKTPIDSVDATKFFISSPNRNRVDNPPEVPKNKFHVREWTPGELYEILTKHFKHVTLMNDHGELKDLDMKDAVMLFKCEVPL